MSVTIYTDIEQGTDDWMQARCGILTASVIGKLITPTLKLANNDTSRGVVETLVAERLTGRVDFTFPSADMRRGELDEPIARDLYANHYAPVEQVGFILRKQDGWRLGYSPDGLVGEDGLIEIKSRRPRIQMQTILAGTVPTGNRAQIQTGLFVTGRKWCDFISYSGGMHLYVERVRPDPAWFEVIEAAATEFENNATALAAQYRAATENLFNTEYVDHYADEIRI